MKVVDVPKEQIKAQGAVVLENLDVLDDPAFIGQRKFNGMKVFVIKKGQKVYIVSGRSWKQSYQHRPYLQEAVRAIQAYGADFEVEAEGTFFLKGTLEEPDPLVTMNCTDETAQNYDFKLVFHTLLGFAGKKESGTTYRESLNCLACFPFYSKQIMFIETYYTEKQKHDAWEQDRIRGKWEGMMFKRIDGPNYQEGKDSQNNLKLKQMYLEEHGNHEQDCLVIGLTRGKGKNEPTFGALLLAQYETQDIHVINKLEPIGKILRRLRYVGKCSGMTDAMRQQIYNSAELKPAAAMPTDLWKQMKDAKVSGTEILGYWPKGPVVQIHYLKANPSGLYLSPQFDRLRDDKPQEECIQK